MPRFDEDDELLEEYSRYVRSSSGIPDDYDTWVQSEYGESKKRARRAPKQSNKYHEY